MYRNIGRSLFDDDDEEVAKQNTLKIIERDILHHQLSFFLLKFC